MARWLSVSKLKFPLNIFYSEHTIIKQNRNNLSSGKQLAPSARVDLNLSLDSKGNSGEVLRNRIKYHDCEKKNKHNFRFTAPFKVIFSGYICSYFLS